MGQLADDVELFPTNLYQKVYVHTINARVACLTLIKFESLSPCPSDTYFARAEYDIKNRTFKPEVESWPTLCSCKTPQNPL